MLSRDYDLNANIEAQNEEVKLKANAAKIYCETATNFNKENGSKV